MTCTSDFLPSVTLKPVNSHKQHVVLSTCVSCSHSKLNNLCAVFTDTELTFNYNLHCVGNRRATCNCGSDNCSGFLGVQPTVRSSSSNDYAVISRAIPFFVIVLTQVCSYCFPQSAVVLEKEEKAKNAKLKPKKRKLRLEGKHTHEYYCFCCGEGGELVMCDRKDCPKAYHLLCLNLTKPPYGNTSFR